MVLTMFDTLSINCSFPNLDDGLHNRSDVSNIPSPFTVNEVNMSSIQIAATNQLYDWSSAFAWDAFESGRSWIKRIVRSKRLKLIPIYSHSFVPSTLDLSLRIYQFLIFKSRTNNLL